MRIAEATHNNSASLQRAVEKQPLRRNSYETNLLDDLQSFQQKEDQLKLGNGKINDGLRTEEQVVLDNIAEALARLGRVKRVGLGVEDKEKFVTVWTKRRR